ncbi:hypothetical protein K501DRAFT_274538 [Backusella circina FSU 941]|nr:hypothetical protein K501DRAFT_274538 [Backusella circina FSU 941]
MSNLMRKFKTAYKDSTRASYNSETIPNLSSLFAQSRLNKLTVKRGAETAPAGSTTTSSSSSNEIYICSSSTEDESYTSFLTSPSLSAPDTTKAKLFKYIEK